MPDLLIQRSQHCQAVPFLRVLLVVPQDLGFQDDLGIQCCQQVPFAQVVLVAPFLLDDQVDQVDQVHPLAQLDPRDP